MWTSRVFSFSALLLMVPLVSGCGEQEGISHSKWPRTIYMQRFLGAIIPGAEKIWFVKLVGPELEIGEQKKNFDAFLHSFEFPEPNKPSWKLPEGWQASTEPAKEGRFATIRIGGEKKGLELTVTSLDANAPQAASLEANINRWRRQIGLYRITREVELEDYYQAERIAGIDSFVVDMVGPGAIDRDAGKDPPPPPPEQFKYKIPEGWKKGPPVQFSVLSFEIRDGDKRAVFTLSQVGGDLLQNINRWYDILGLDKIDEKALARLPEVTIAGSKAKLVDITGERAPPERNRFLGAILPQPGDSAWYFKMTGPADVVGRQRKNFDAFLESFSFKN